MSINTGYVWRTLSVRNETSRDSSTGSESFDVKSEYDEDRLGESKGRKKVSTVRT